MEGASSISEEDINRFIDGELSSSERSFIQAQLALRPDLAARVFAEAQRMETLRSAQPERLFPPRESLEGAKQLETAFRRRRLFALLRLQVAAVCLIAIGWVANSLTVPFGQDGKTVDENFILSAREALRVAQLDAGPQHSGEPKLEKIERLAAALNIAMPALPKTWRVKDVQLQTWNDRQRLVVTADTPTLGPVTLVAAPMTGELLMPPTPAKDGRIPTVYWQSGGTAFALMGPAAPERLENEAKGMEIATRKNVGPKVRG